MRGRQSRIYGAKELKWQYKCNNKTLVECKWQLCFLSLSLIHLEALISPTSASASTQTASPLRRLHPNSLLWLPSCSTLADPQTITPFVLPILQLQSKCNRIKAAQFETKANQNKCISSAIRPRTVLLNTRSTKDGKKGKYARIQERERERERESAEVVSRLCFYKLVSGFGLRCPCFCG